jgi:ATP-dependent RNA helicase DDX55/SPB4
VTPLTTPSISVTKEDIDRVTNTIRKVAKSDRAIYDKAQRGFVSWVRAYSKHTASSIFRVEDLDWAELGAAWGLLRLPRMPETKKWEGDKSLGVTMDFDAFAYKDKVREQQRQTEVAEAAAQGNTGKKFVKENKIAKAWTDQKDQKATKELRREKKVAKREQERKSKMTDEERQKEDELNRMISQMRKKVKQTEAAAEEDEFQGFDD